MGTSHRRFILTEMHRGEHESVRETQSAPSGPASWRVPLGREAKVEAQAEKGVRPTWVQTLS